MRLSRREVLIGAVAACCGGGLGALARGIGAGTHHPSAHGRADNQSHPADCPSAEQALELLKSGNARFASGNPIHPHTEYEWRCAIADGQQPYAAILGCCDSRVAPEVIFDEGLGELFVVRQAGHVADDDTLGSLEYAVGHLHIPLVVVLGHQGCGAIEAAIGALLKEQPIEGHVIRLIDDIAPAVTEAQSQPGDLLDNSVRANIQHVVRRLRACGPTLRGKVRRNEVRIVGAYYPLRTGKVEWM